MWSENQCYLVTADLLHIRLTFRPGHISCCNYNSRDTFSPANRLGKVRRLILLLAKKKAINAEMLHCASSAMNHLLLSFSLTPNTNNPLLQHICIVFLPHLINCAEPRQFTVTLILPPSASPMKPIIARLFTLSTLSLRNHLCEAIS